LDAVAYLEVVFFTVSVHLHPLKAPQLSWQLLQLPREFQEFPKGSVSGSVSISLNIMFPVLLRMVEIFFVALQRPAFLLEDVADPFEDGRKLDVCFQLSWPGPQLLLHWYWHLAANASPFLDMFTDALIVTVCGLE
jgi:hypothetical protein